MSLVSFSLFVHYLFNRSCSIPIHVTKRNAIVQTLQSNNSSFWPRGLEPKRKWPLLPSSKRDNNNHNKMGQWDHQMSSNPNQCIHILLSYVSIGMNHVPSWIFHSQVRWIVPSRPRLSHVPRFPSKIPLVFPDDRLANDILARRV